MHDKLFANQSALKRPDLERYAGELGLDLVKFRNALDDHKAMARIQADMAAGQALGVPFTPVFFINGRPLGGAQEFSEWKRIIDDELVLAQGLIAQGVAPDKLYERLMQGAAMPQAKAAPVSVSTAVYKVDLGAAPLRGARQPKVTIVEYCDFQCPYCKGAQPVLGQVLAQYGQDVALVWKHMPLPIHKQAALAALAAEAAHAQGKFWEMHDLLFANQGALERPSLEKYAQDLGLDLVKFKAGLDVIKPGNVVDGDAQQAQRLALSATPSFFVNGRSLVGAPPLEGWKALIDEEIKKADARLAAGVPRERLYEELTKGGLEKGEAPPSAAESRSSSLPPGLVMRVDIGDAPVRGAKDALVTLVVFSDFQCPFCGKVEPTLAKVMEAYPGKVRMVWKDFPLPFHPNAMPAALAARAAGQQGKFWPMHDRLFADQTRLDRAGLEAHAQALGLDLARFRAALDSASDRAAVLADQRQGSAAGVSGTPAFYVNGVKLSGALPFESFKSVIDEQLAKARKLVASGTPAAQVYPTLMKKAYASVTEAARAQQGAKMAVGHQGRRP
jgi:protein-disulfide isomerase